MVSEYGSNAGVSGSLSVSGSVTFKGESDVNVDSNTLFVDASANSVGVGTTAPIASLDVAGKIAISSESSTPSQPADGKGYLYTKTDGKLYWRSYDLGETDLTAAGSGISHDGSTADGVLTYKDSDEATVESTLTFNGTLLKIDAASPIVRLDADGGTHGKLEWSVDGTRKWLIYNDHADDNLEFKTNTDIRMVIEQDGNVGIGTASPTYELDVAGDIGIDEHIYHNGDADTYIAFNAQNQINLVANGHSFLKYDGDIKINNANRDRNTQIMADDGNVVLHVDAGDNKVGIGNTSPDYTLDVAGNIGLDEYIKHNGDSDTYIRFQADDINIQAGGVDFIKITEDDSQDLIEFNVAEADVDFIVNNTNDEVLRIDTTGVVFNEDGHATNDFRVESDGEDEAIFLDAGANTLYVNKGATSFTTVIKNNNEEAIRVGASGIIFNEYSHASMDFRVESDSNTHMLFVDAGEDKIGINTSSPSTQLHMTGDLTVGGDIILDDGGSIKEAGGTAAVTIDGSGHVTKIGQDSPSSDEVLTWDGSKAVWSAAGGGNEYYHITLSGRVKNTSGNLFGHAAYPYNAGDSDWTTSISSFVSNWTSGGTTFDANYRDAILYWTIGVAPAAMSLNSARIAYYMANDDMSDDYIWEMWKATPTSGTGYTTSLEWTRVGYIDLGGDPSAETFYAATGSITAGNSLAAGDLIGLTVHNPGDTYTSKYHGYHLVLRFTYS